MLHQTVGYKDCTI